MRYIYSRDIKKQAVAALNDRQVDYRRMVFCHTAVSSLFVLVVSLFGLLIDQSIVETEGLDGIGRAGFLKFVYTVLMLAGNILLPFWAVGISYTSVRVVRRQNTDFSMLTQGLRRFLPLTGYGAMLGLIYLGVGVACFYALMIPFMCLPVPEHLQTAIASLDFTDVSQIEAFQTEYFWDMMRYSLPLIISFTVIYGIIATILRYRFRMCAYMLLEDNRAGVMPSFGISSRMTKGERKNLFLLDLSFWWYHLAMFVFSLVIYVPDIMNQMGVILPVSYETASLCAYVVYMICSLILIGLAGAYYQTSMACAYETLRNREDSL